MFSQVLTVHYSTGLRTVFHSPSLTCESHRFPLRFPPLCFAQGRDALRVVIRVADIMKVIVIRANVPRSQDTVALFASKAQHLVPMGIRLIVLSLLT